jgi:hypothetical protein
MKLNQAIFLRSKLDKPTQNFRMVMSIKEITEDWWLLLLQIVAT